MSPHAHACLLLLRVVLLMNTVHAGRGALLLELILKVQGRGAMDLFFEDGLVLDGLVLGLQAVVAGRDAEAVAAAARLGGVVGGVLEFVHLFAPGWEWY